MSIVLPALLSTGGRLQGRSIETGHHPAPNMARHETNQNNSLFKEITLLIP